MKLAEEETFGPVAACFRFTSEDEVIQRANNTPYGLAAYFYTQNLARVFRVSQAIESGMIGINECAVSTELGPFGGVKESGLGARRVRAGAGRVSGSQNPAYWGIIIIRRRRPLAWTG